MPGEIACKVCHGPLASLSTVPKSSAVAASASRLLAPIPEEVECHPHCLSFACPGCVAQDRPSYSILDFNNQVYDYHCAVCMAEEAFQIRGLAPACASQIATVSLGAGRTVC